MRRVIAGVAIFTAACGGGQAASPLSPSTSGTYAGAWMGTTSQARPIGFVVSVDTVGQLEFSVGYSTATCNGGMSYGSTSPLTVVTGSAFAATMALAGPPGVVGFRYAITGRFWSSTSADGTLRISGGPQGLSGCAVDTEVTWTATRTP